MTLLKAINEVKDKVKIKLLIIGEGDQKSNLFSFIDQNNLEKIVKIKDRIENPFPYILKSEIMILSSRFEGLPNILLEAMAASLPIACSNRGPMPEILKDAGIYFNPEQVSSITINSFSNNKRESNASK